MGGIKMKKFGKISAALVLLFLMSSIGVVTADRQITTNSASQRSPDISGDRVVWQDGRNGNSDIYMYNLSTGIESPISIDPLRQEQFHPRISGNRIIWLKEYYGTARRDLLMYDISTGEERPIFLSSPSYSTLIRNPAISGNHIVWDQVRAGWLWDIYIYNISDNTGRFLYRGDANEAHTPAISGDRVAWVKTIVTGSGINHDIWMYNISTDTFVPIATDPADQFDPAISGNYIVYTDNRNGNDEIYMYDLFEERERRITTNIAGQTHPAISGDRIVWMDYRNGLNPDIYMYNISTRRQNPITLNASVQEYPAISGKNIVWADSRTGNWDIFVYTTLFVNIILDPDVRFPWLNDILRTERQWINVFIEPSMPMPMPPAPSPEQSPEQQKSPDAYDFDIPSIKLIISPVKSIQIKELVLPVDKKAPSKIGDHDGDGILDLMVKFDMAKVINYLEKINKNKYGIRTEYEVKIIGNLKDGTPFESKLANKELDKLPPP